MKRLALILAILSFPFAASAANEVTSESIQHSQKMEKLCWQSGEDSFVCWMKMAYSEEYALTGAEIAMEFCEYHEKWNPDDKVYANKCARRRAYIKERWTQ